MKFKYIDKYWKKGRWNYVYPNDTKNRPLNQPKNVTPGFGICLLYTSPSPRDS